MLDAAKGGRHGVRDNLLLLVMFRHGLRVSEAVAFRRDEVDLDRARLWVRRLKGGLSVEQPIAGDELRAFRRYFASREDSLPWLFISERGSASDPAVRELPDCHRRRPRQASAGPPTHASSFVRVRSGQQGLRPASHPGLPRPSRSKAYRPLHPRRRPAFRRALALNTGEQS